MEESKLGRLYPQNGIGLQGFPSAIRAPLLKKYYYDCDIENAHYNLVLKVAKDRGIVHTAVEKYCKNREEELNKLSKDRKLAKNSYLKVAYGGNIKLYSNHYEDCGMPEGNTDLLREVEKEMKNIAEVLYNAHPEFHKLVKKEPNPHFSLLAHLLQTEERKCLMTMDAYLISKGRSMDILIHDGGCVRKLPDEVVFPQELLNGMMEAFKKQLDYDVKIILKPFVCDFVPPEVKILPNDVLVNDVYASQKFIELMGDDILLSNNRVYLFDANTGIWTDAESVLRSKIVGMKTALVFRQLNGLGVVIPYDYSGNLKSIDKLVKVLPSVLEELFPEKCNDDFLEDGKKKAMNKLLFKNGIYDFTTNTLGGYDRTIVFMSAVPLNFVKEPVKEDVDFVFKKLFRDPFKNYTKADIFLHYLMRGMIGDYFDKKFLAMIGMADSSKGVLTKAFEAWFGNVVGIFGANNLLYRKQFDPSKDVGFLINIADCRIAFSSEVKPGEKLSNELLKQVVSGGDTLVGRKLYENDRNFVMRARLVMMCNDFPGVKPADEAVSSRMIPITYDYSFKEVITNPFCEKKADKTIKLKLTTGEGIQQYGMAMFHIFMRAYEDWKAKEFAEPKLTDEIKEAQEELAPKDELMEALETKYEFTKDQDDKVLTEEIVAYITETRKLTYSANMIGRILTNNDCASKNIKVGKKVMKHRLGIKVRNDWVDEEKKQEELRNRREQRNDNW